ncbi:hypothetical protein C0Z01_02895 [Photobacterium kishitanii]|uniref:Uncharacterized protein n=1 Tax=Photobacterium kishitanii TaxID=318456 RepID=A0AAX0YZW3_9GAMM|nr:hypothetical protein [Photobacterium kishitanii]KJG08358.1 hypothetical protein UB40_18425 [Photobacterium kishitanii]KJG55639.1 hypothetical protein UA38_18625 [Photobacterium kishitanii]KJG60786.1 hypothetical protein UA42_13815 [Photobacterium kishitanii]KJG64642.1 hypothetical protein UA40_15930 [Photobacterium kishitanii]KJG69155.1 hypothetical protein UA41_13250 [Photobacterium kishitanii]
MKKVSPHVMAKLSNLSKTLLIINLIFLISDFSLFILYGSMLALICSWLMLANIVSIRYQIKTLYKDNVIAGYLRCAFIPFSVARDAKRFNARC